MATWHRLKTVSSFTRCGPYSLNEMFVLRTFVLIQCEVRAIGLFLKRKKFRLNFALEIPAASPQIAATAALSGNICGAGRSHD